MLAEVVERLFQDLPSDFLDEPHVLGERNEVGWIDPAVLVVVPPRKGFDA